MAYRFHAHWKEWAAGAGECLEDDVLYRISPLLPKKVRLRANEKVGLDLVLFSWEGFTISRCECECECDEGLVGGRLSTLPARPGAPEAPEAPSVEY